MHVNVARHGVQPTQPINEPHVAVVLNRDESRLHKWCIGRKTGENRAGRYTKEARQRRTLDVEKFHAFQVPEDVVHQRLDDRLRAVAEQDFKNRHVRSSQVHLFSKPPEPQRRPVSPHVSRR